MAIMVACSYRNSMRVFFWTKWLRESEEELGLRLGLHSFICYHVWYISKTAEAKSSHKPNASTSTHDYRSKLHHLPTEPLSNQERQLPSIQHQRTPPPGSPLRLLGDRLLLWPSHSRSFSSLSTLILKASTISRSSDLWPGSRSTSIIESMSA